MRISRLTLPVFSTKRRDSKFSQSAGFTLVEIAIVMIIASFIAVAFFTGLRIYLKEKQDYVVTEREREIRRGISNFISAPPDCRVGEIPKSAAHPEGAICVVPGAAPTPEVSTARPIRFPCPSSLETPFDDATYGREACPPDTNGNGQLDLADFGGYWGNQDGVWVLKGEGGQPVLIGAVPTQTLGIPAMSGIDIYGNRYFYAVSLDAVAKSGAASVKSKIAPRIKVFPQAQGQPFLNDFFIFSAGSDGRGAFTHLSGAIAEQCGDWLDTEHGDAWNCKWQATPNGTPANAEFVQRDQGNFDVPGTKHYDDRTIVTLEDAVDSWWEETEIGSGIIRNRNGSGDESTRVHITSTGRIGVGTASPNTPVDVRSGAGAVSIDPDVAAGGTVAAVTSTLNSLVFSVGQTPNASIGLGSVTTTNTLDAANGTGTKLWFDGANDPDVMNVCGDPRDYNTRNSDNQYMGRYNVSSDRSEFRTSFGDFLPVDDVTIPGYGTYMWDGSFKSACGTRFNFSDKFVIGAELWKAPYTFTPLLTVNSLGNAEVKGAIKVGQANVPCDSTSLGAIQYNQVKNAMEFCAAPSQAFIDKYKADNPGWTVADLPTGVWRPFAGNSTTYREVTYMPCETVMSKQNMFNNACATFNFGYKDIQVYGVSGFASNIRDLSSQIYKYQKGRISIKRAKQGNLVPPERLGNKPAVGVFGTPGSLFGPNTGYVARSDGRLNIRATIPIELTQRRTWRFPSAGNPWTGTTWDTTGGTQFRLMPPALSDGSGDGSTLDANNNVSTLNANNSAGGNNYYGNSWDTEYRGVWENNVMAALFVNGQLVVTSSLINPAMTINVLNNGGVFGSTIGGTGTMIGEVDVSADQVYDIEIYVFTLGNPLWGPDPKSGLAGTIKYGDVEADGVVELTESAVDPSMP